MTNLSAIEAHLKEHRIFRMAPGLWAWNPRGLIPVHEDHDSAEGVYNALVASGDLPPVAAPDPAVVALVRAARRLHDNIAEYRRINNLPGPPNDDAVAVARALAPFQHIKDAE